MSRTGEGEPKDRDASAAPAHALGSAGTQAAPKPNVPAHVAIIMDGNGRWAAARGLPRFEGHRRGMEALRRAVRAAQDLGVRYLTVYSFSAENWTRPPAEVQFLMGLLKRFVKNDLAALHEAGVRVRVIGSRDGLAPAIASLLDDAEALTLRNASLDLVIAFNYGARQEIAAAARALAARVAKGELAPQAIDEAAISNELTTAAIPDPDMILRTSGEERLSNFLLWQAAYAEFVFMPILWPDFDRAAFEQALEEFGRRTRRFGGLGDDAARTG
jgi:undecaprenyl diphosphate synthase